MYNIPMYAVCPNCGNSVYDHGESPNIRCEICGHRILSRAYSEVRSGTSENRNTDTEHDKIVSSKPTPASLVFTPFQALFNFFASIAIICFIIILLINFFAFFPAIAITTPELINQHKHEVKTSVPLIIDNSAPNFSLIQNDTMWVSPGQIIELQIKSTDEDVNVLVLDTPGFTRVNNQFYYDHSTDHYSAPLQAPTEPGQYRYILKVSDFAGNMKTKNLDLNVLDIDSSYITIKNPTNFYYLNSSTEIELGSWDEELFTSSYRINLENGTTAITPGSKLTTSNWSEGENAISFISRSNAGVKTFQNISIYIDNTKPKIQNQLIEPLTQARNKTFKNRLNNSVFYRGEFVRIKVNITDENLAQAKIMIDDREYALSKVEKSEYQSVLSLPQEPDKYNVKCIAEDMAGNIQILSTKIQIARINFNYIPLPIFRIIDDKNISMNLPFVNSSNVLTLNAEIGKIQKIQYTFYHPNSSSPIIKTIEDQYINLTTIPEGEVTFTINTRVSYIYWDYLFVTFPFPPFLFVLPIQLTGWALVVFYMLVAISIIYSNFHLFRTSLVQALNRIVNSLGKTQKALVESKNAILMIAQLFLAIFTFSLLYNIILGIFSVSAHTPDFSSLSLWALIFNLTSAAVYEEVISRILLIGLPLLLIHALMKKLKKPKWRYILGGEFQINKLTLLLIVFSSLTFGLAHAPGWDYWKVLPSLVSGLALGYLYVVKGVYASIILHFTINFLSIPLQMTNYPLGPSVLFSLLIYFWLFIGFIYIFIYSKRLVQTVTDA
jgi:DNA-directed RNA polymerase subunit RPC12/RpoP